MKYNKQNGTKYTLTLQFLTDNKFLPASRLVPVSVCVSQSKMNNIPVDFDAQACVSKLIELNVLIESFCCGKKMSLIQLSKSIDGCVQQCSLCSKRLSIRANSWLYGSKLQLHQILRFVDLWIENVPLSTIERQVNIGRTCAVRLNRFFYEIV